MLPYKMTGGPGIGLFPTQFRAQCRNAEAVTRVAGSLMMLETVAGIVNTTEVVEFMTDGGGYGERQSRYSNLMDLNINNGTNPTDRTCIGEFGVLTADIEAGQIGEVAFAEQRIQMFVNSAGVLAPGTSLFPNVRGAVNNAISSVAVTSGDTSVCIGRLLEQHGGTGQELRWVQFIGIGGGLGSFHQD